MNPNRPGNPNGLPPPPPGPDARQLCHVCEEVYSTGQHYGAETCKSCALFFAGAVRNSAVYFCQGQPINLCRLRTCNSCRLIRCHQLGMRSEDIVPQFERDEAVRRRVARDHLTRERVRALAIRYVYSTYAEYPLLLQHYLRLLPYVNQVMRRLVYRRQRVYILI